MTSLRTRSLGSDARAQPSPIRVLVILLPAVVALVLGINRSMRVPLWRDEYATAMHAALSIGDLVRSLSSGDAVQGPYYLLIHLLSPFTGLGHGMRVVSLLAFAATAALVSALALRWWGAWPAAAAGLFFSLDGAAVTAGMTARPYALTLFFVALAIFAADRAGSRRRWGWAVYSAAAALAVAMHVISLAALLCIGMLSLARTRAWLSRWIVWSTPALALAVGLTLVGRSQQAQIAWLTAADLRSGISALAQVAGVSAYRAVVWDALGLIVLIAAAGASAVAIGRATAASAKVPRLRPVLFAAVLGFAAPAVLFVLSWAIMPVYTARYLSWVSLGSALLVGAAVFAATLRARIPSAIAGACAAVLLAGATVVAGQQFSQPTGIYDDAPSLVTRIDRDAEIGDALAVIQRGAHNGLAYSVARTTRDDAWATDVVDRLPRSAQPVVEIRSLAGTAPVDLTPISAAAAVGTGLTVWIVSLDSPSRAEIDEIEGSLGCTADTPIPDPTFFGGMRLYSVRCE